MRRLGGVLKITALVVSFGSAAAGQDCVCGHPCDVVLENQTVSTPQTFEACLSIVAGNGLVIEPPATVLLRAGDRVVLIDEFMLEADPEMIVEIDPSLACDPTADLDEDGVNACFDCDDDNSGVFPGAEEICDGVDNDCNGVTDEGVDCSDGLACTVDSCAGVSGCQWDLSPDNCLIEGTCFDHDQLNPSNDCQICNVASSQDSWTTLPDGTACNGPGYECRAGVCELICFAPGTLVPTLGGMLPIEQIRPGMLVPSYSPIEGTLAFRPVTAVERRPAVSLVRLRVGEEEILVTPDHPFATSAGGWVAARELRDGEALFNLHGQEVVVSSVESAELVTSSTPWVYNLRVQGTGTYFIGRSHVLVNSCNAPTDVVAQPRSSMDVRSGALLGSGFPMLIHNALVPSLSLAISGPTTDIIALPCLPVGRWSLLIGERDGYLIIVDNEDHSIKLVSRELLNGIVSGEKECAEDANLIAVRVLLGHEDVAFGGVIADDRVFLSYFATRRVEVFQWTGAGGSLLPSLKVDREMAIRANDQPGLSSIAVWKDRLWAADVNWICEVPNCAVRFGPSRLFVLDLSSKSPRVTQSSPTAIANAGGLYIHEPGDSLYVIAAGSGTSGSSIVQRIEEDGSPGSAVVLPDGARVERGYRIDDDLFALLQLSGHHVFFIDSSTDSLIAVQRFDGEQFHRVAMPTARLADRSEAVLRQVIPEPGIAGRFYLVDSKGEQIVYVEFDPSIGGFRTLGRFPVGLPEAVTAPNWGVPLRQ